MCVTEKHEMFTFKGPVGIQWQLVVVLQIATNYTPLASPFLSKRAGDETVATKNAQKLRRR